MKKTLEKKSGILKIKSKFFINRALIYSCFLLIPVWIPRIVLELGNPLKILMLFLYSLFMIGQWFLLGKEIDYRLKIYFRANSSMDRLLCRLLLGMFAMLLYFNLLSFIPGPFLRHCFWGTWIGFGLFYSWPTRGKIVEETFSKQLGEFHFLDPFEKTILGLIVIFFLFSIPKLPSFEDITVLQLFFDPMERMSSLFWNFLAINFYPFTKYPDLYRMAICLHFYFVGVGLFLLAFYGVLRFFVSRRPSLLGVFAVISSWTFCKILETHEGAAIHTTFSILIVWGFLWSLKSSTYRSGLLLGLIGLWGTILDGLNVMVLPLQLIFSYFFFLQEKTFWFKRQFLKYASFGLILSLALFSFQGGVFDLGVNFSLTQFLRESLGIIEKKAFFSLALVGIIFFPLTYFRPQFSFLRQWNVDRDAMNTFGVAFLIIATIAIVRPQTVLGEYALMWPLCFLSVMPLEWIFQIISRFRSQRNMIYLIYILICLLDSHVEGRVKNLLEVFYGQ